MKNLVIVESPSKTKTIKQFLGDDYSVIATKGHIRDIDNCGVDNLGIDFKHNYKPIYTIISKQYATIKSLNEAVSKADRIFLATDPDREGEAISWHLNEVLKLEGKPVKRIEFNEITEPAILSAIENPRDIDTKLFESQETRKIIDRIIGYKLSTLLKRSVGSEENSSVSAGRVQSAALKIICDREKEIQKFVPEVYFEVVADLKDYKIKVYDRTKNKVKVFDHLEEAQTCEFVLDNTYTVTQINKSNKSERPQAPFTTSTLIQAALNKYALSSSRTMKIAQELYEGIEVDGMHIAFITYMRTDSTRISDVFQKQLASFIINKYGKENLAYIRSKKNENSQDAHEAIRPVDLRRTPESVQQYLSKEQLLVYSMIYNQTVESMMKDASIEVSQVIFNNSGVEFVANFEKTVFPGFKLNRKESEEKQFNLSIGDIVKAQKPAEIVKNETSGPKRFTEATLIKEMESSGIGRPSTYASTITTLKTRKYVSITKKSIVPTEQGNIASSFLDTYFGEIINVDYTAQMEKTLDEIATGEKEEQVVVPEFYESFTNILKKQKDIIAPMETGELCPHCGSKMVYKTNRYGRFEACSNYPECKYIKKKEVEDIPVIECPECHKGHLVQRIAKGGKMAGKKFYGCSNYPKCKFTISSLNGIKKN